MAIQSISISIYDTSLPSISEANILDYAERSSIHWIYDGGDNKMLTMMPSRIEFDMEVSIEDSLNELVYDYLFTGNETRYSVVMRDQDDKVLWRGFLIPEEYAEPYETGTYFIHFTATDGLGRLKGHNLPASFYKARQSVIKTFADCLRLTGLELDIWVDSAIVNAVAEAGAWELIYIDAQQYNTGDKPDTAYDILNGILEEIGATLFQQDNRWYIKGINKRGNVTSGYRKYDAFGKYLGQNIEPVKLPKTAYWYATPTIYIKPPFKEVSVKENLLPEIDLFPTELIAQPWTMKESGQVPPPVKFWRQVGKGDVQLQDASDWSFRPWEDEEFEQDAYVGLHVSEPDIPRPPSWPASADNYITLFKDIYIKGQQYIDFDFVWDIRIYNPTNTNYDFYINEGLWYEVTVDGFTVISNRHLFPPRNNFLWDDNGTRVWSEDYTMQTCTVKVRKFWLEYGGLMNIKFYTINTSNSPPPVDIRFKQLSFTYRKDVESFFKKRRVIDYTTSKEINIAHGGSVFDLMKNSYIYQPKIEVSEFINIPVTVVDSEAAIVLADGNYVLLVIPNIRSVYVKRENSDFYEYIHQVSANMQNNKIKIFFEDNHAFQPGDKLYVRPGVEGTPQTTPVIEAREKWEKTTNSNGEDRLGNVLAELNHDIYPTPILAMEGTVKGLIQPKDYLQYELKNQMRNFLPVRIDMKPNENESSVTLIEYKNENVTDYGG